MKKTTKAAAAKKTTKKATEIVTKGSDRTHKICSVCKLPQPLDMFYRPAKDCRCKGCGSAYAKALKARKEAEAAQGVAAARKTETVKKPAASKKTAAKAPKTAPTAKKVKKAA